MTSRITDLRTIEHLALVTGTDAPRIADYANSQQQATFFKRIRIPKRGKRRSGQFRVIFKTKDEWLRDFHAQVANLLRLQAHFDIHVQGFVRTRSMISNARLHLNAPTLRHADLTQFFDRISVEQVRRAFVSIGISADMAELLARATTIEGFLRQGTRCAPILANLVCAPLDAGMLTLASAHNARYSRYADDLTFSGVDLPSQEQIRAVIELHGFELRDGRCYTQFRGRCQYVTGLTINHADRPRLPVRMKRNMRLVLYYVQKYGVDGHFARVGTAFGYKHRLAIEGALRFFHSVEPLFVVDLSKRFPSATAELGWGPSPV